MDYNVWVWVIAQGGVCSVEEEEVQKRRPGTPTSESQVEENSPPAKEMKDGERERASTWETKGEKAGSCEDVLCHRAAKCKDQMVWVPMMTKRRITKTPFPTYMAHYAFQALA